MMSASAIIDLARQVAVKAAAAEVEPYRPRNAEECRTGWVKRIPIPQLGDYRPEGWRLIAFRTVDKTGWGKSWEPALTIPAFREWAAECVEDDPQAGFAIIEESEFQIVIGYFSTDKSVEQEPDAAEAYGTDGSEYSITVCDDCGEPFDTNEDETCPSCGWDPNPAPTCPECEEELEEDGSCFWCEKRPCKNCGEWISTEVEDTCPECGHDPDYNPAEDERQLQLDL